MIRISKGPETARYDAYRQGVSIYQLWMPEHAAVLYERLRKRAQRDPFKGRQYHAGMRDALRGMVDAL